MVLIFGKSNDSLKELMFLIFNKSRIEYKAIHDPQCFKPLKNIESFSAQIRAEFLTLPTQLRCSGRGSKRPYFEGLERGFLPQNRCFGDEHFCPLAVKVLTSAEDFVYN
jgi:hypothetical protein